VSEKTKPEAIPEELTKKRWEGVSGGDTYLQFLNSNSSLTDQELAHVVGRAGTTIGPTGAASVEPHKATVMGAGSDAQPGFHLGPIHGNVGRTRLEVNQASGMKEPNPPRCPQWNTVLIAMR
jgi:hypothetical protein